MTEEITVLLANIKAMGRSRKPTTPYGRVDAQKAVWIRTSSASTANRLNATSVIKHDRLKLIPRRQVW